MCGGQARIFGGGREEVVKPPETDEAIRAWLVFGSAFVHPTVMFRREALEKAGGRYAAVVGVEDYDLWLRMAEVTRMANLPEELLRYRMHAAQYTATKSDRHFQELDRLRLAWLAGKGLRLDEEEAMAHRALVFDRRPDESPRPWRVAAWLRRLREELPAAGWCGRAALREMVAERWWAWMLQRGRGGPGAALAYAAGPVGGLGGRELRRGARLLLGRLAPGGGRPGRGT